MKIAIIGGGPAVYYAAILLRKQRPEAQMPSTSATALTIRSASA